MGGELRVRVGGGGRGRERTNREYYGITVALRIEGCVCETRARW